MGVGVCVCVSVCPCMCACVRVLKTGVCVKKTMLGACRELREQITC